MLELSEYHSIDVFIQGFFLVTCVFLGIGILILDNRKEFGDCKKLRDYVSKVKDLMSRVVKMIGRNFIDLAVKDSKFSIASTATGIILLIVVSGIIYASGVFVASQAESWINIKYPNNPKQMSLDNIWLKDDNALKANGGEYRHVSDDIKLQQFDRIMVPQNLEKLCVIDTCIEPPCFDSSCLRDIAACNQLHFYPDNKLQYYYGSKHVILKDELYAGYLYKNIIIVNYTSVLAMSLFILFLISYVNVIVMWYRWFNKSWMRSAWVILNAILWLACFKWDSLGVSDYLATNVVIYTFLFLPVGMLVVGYFSCYVWSKQVYKKIILIEIHQHFRQRVFYVSILSYIFLYGSFLGCMINIKSWELNERKIASKVYGLSKNLEIDNESTFDKGSVIYKEFELYREYCDCHYKMIEKYRPEESE